MSGTSLDGIDVAIIDIAGSGFKAKINVLTSHSVPYPKKIREALLAVSNANTLTGDISRLNFLLGELYAEALEETAERADIPLDTIKLIGCHGQTIFHEGQGCSVLGKEGSEHFSDWRVERYQRADRHRRDLELSASATWPPAERAPR